MCSPGWASAAGRCHSEVHTSIPANLRCWHTFYPVLPFSWLPHVCCARTRGLPSQRAPNSLGISSVSGRKGWLRGTSLGKEEKKSPRSTRWCCEHTDTQVLHTAESLLLLVIPSRASQPRHWGFRGRSVHLAPPWRKMRTPRRVHLKDLVGFPSQVLPGTFAEGLALFEDGYQRGVSGIHPVQQNCCHPAPSKGIQEESK